MGGVLCRPDRDAAGERALRLRLRGELADARPHPRQRQTSCRRSPIYDVVHVNAEFANQTSDHDPSVIGSPTRRSSEADEDRKPRHRRAKRDRHVHDSGDERRTAARPPTSCSRTRSRRGAEFVSVNTSQGTCTARTDGHCNLEHARRRRRYGHDRRSRHRLTQAGHGHELRQRGRRPGRRANGQDNQASRAAPRCSAATLPAHRHEGGHRPGNGHERAGRDQLRRRLQRGLRRRDAGDPHGDARRAAPRSPAGRARAPGTGPCVVDDEPGADRHRDLHADRAHADRLEGGCRDGHRHELTGRDQLRGRLLRGLHRGDERHAHGDARERLQLHRLVGRLHGNAAPAPSR